MDLVTSYTSTQGTYQNSGTTLWRNEYNARRSEADGVLSSGNLGALSQTPPGGELFFRGASSSASDMGYALFSSQTAVRSIALFECAERASLERGSCR